MSRLLLAALAAAALLVAAPGATGAARPPKVPPPVAPPTGFGSQVDAANALLALPWDGQRRQAEQDARNGIAALDGKTIAHGNGNVGGFRWSFDVNLKDVAGSVDLSAPPGFRTASPSGFTLEAPLGRTWSLGLSGNVRARAKVTAAGQTILDAGSQMPFGLRIPNFHLTATTVLDSTQPDRPRFVSGTIVPRFTMQGSGMIPTIPVILKVRLADGKIVISTAVTGLAVKLGPLSGSLNGDLVLTILPADQDLVISSPLGTTQLPFQQANLSLQGSLKVSLKRVGTVSVPFDLSSGFLLPSSSGLRLGLAALAPPLPRSWPAAGISPPPVTVPPVGFDYGAVADSVDAAANPQVASAESHLPYGAVLSLDRRNGNITYGREADSAIWTGHYLAAEAFRYAATGSSDAVARVKQSLNGIKLLYTVADAAFDHGKIGPAEDGLLSRTAIPARAKHQLTDGPLQRRGSCFYEHPSGGWKVRSNTYPTYRQALAAVKNDATPASTKAAPKPLGTIWYGFGCGSKPGTDHTISRDQYNGVLMGLAYAYALVPDPEVRAASKDLIERALDFLLRHQWNVPLPPQGRIGTTYLGDFDAQLAYLRIGKTVDPAKYGPIYDRYAAAVGLMWIPAWFSGLDPIVQYYKFNISHAIYGPGVMLETDPQLRSTYLKAYAILRRPTVDHRNAYFDLVDVLVGASTASSPSTGTTVGSEVKGALFEWAQRRQLLAPSAGGLPANTVSDSAAAAIGSLWSTGEDVFPGLFGGRPILAKRPLRLQDRIGNGMDFVWERDPFETGFHGGLDKCGTAASSQRPGADLIKTCGSDANAREGPGVDYLLPYWMAVYLKVVPPPS